MLIRKSDLTIGSIDLTFESIFLIFTRAVNWGHKFPQSFKARKVLVLIRHKLRNRK